MANDVALVGGGENAEKILEKYDFVGTVEKFDGMPLHLFCAAIL